MPADPPSLSDGPHLGVQRLAGLAPAARDPALTAAVAGGVGWVDVADVYGPTAGDAERWLGEVLPAHVRIASKGGLVRDGVKWRPDGRASHLERSAVASLRRLGRASIDLYYLHAPDPRVELETSVRALDRLRTSGIVRGIGVSNVTATELDRAVAIARIDAVQVELSPMRPRSVRSGVVARAQALGIPVVAYRPLGGVDGVQRLRREADLTGLAAGAGLSVEQMVLAWLGSLGVIPLPGPTRRETVEACLAASGVTLDPERTRTLDARFEPGRLRTPLEARRARASADDGEVVVILGIPGSGKTTRARSYDGYLRLNRDERGGTLERLTVDLDRALGEGTRRAVLDNTYGARADRNPVIEVAWAHGLPCRCEWVDTSDNDAEVNVVLRILAAIGRLPEPAEFDVLNRRDAGIVPPRAHHRFRAVFEPPTVDEGFSRVDRIPFERRPWATGDHGALLLDPKDLVPACADTIAGFVASGLVPIVVGWESASDRAILVDRWRARAAAIGLTPAAIEACPHPAGPATCWCRKPLPGLAIAAMLRLGCDPARSVTLGRVPADRALAAKLGVRIAHDRPETDHPPQTSASTPARRTGAG